MTEPIPSWAIERARDVWASDAEEKGHLVAAKRIRDGKIDEFASHTNAPTIGDLRAARHALVAKL